MRKLLDAPNVDNSNPSYYPDGRIRDNDGSGNGTPVNEFVYGDLHQTYLKAKRLYGIIPSGLPDNEINGFQMLEAFIALASKNDFILDITEVSGILNIAVKIGFMKTGEQIVCKATVNKGVQTQIKGIDPTLFTISFVGNFKSGEYVRLIKTVSGVTLVRLVDSGNLDTMAGELSYLKKASQEESDAGTIDTKATTPLVDKTTFIKRVNGSDSPDYLAIPTGVGAKNGLMSSADKYKLDNFESTVKNVGAFYGLNVGTGSPGDGYSVAGDVASAVVQTTGGGSSVVRITLDNDMGDTMWFVRMSFKSQATFAADVEIQTPVWKVINSNTFDMAIRETSGVSQNFVVYVETIKTPF